MCVAMLLKCTVKMNNFGRGPTSVDNCKIARALSTDLFRKIFSMAVDQPLDDALGHKTHHAESQT